MGKEWGLGPGQAGSVSFSHCPELWAFLVCFVNGAHLLKGHPGVGAPRPVAGGSLWTWHFWWASTLGTVTLREHCGPFAIDGSLRWLLRDFSCSGL